MRLLTIPDAAILQALQDGYTTIPTVAEHLHRTRQLVRQRIRRLLASGKVVITKPDYGQFPAEYEAVIKSAFRESHP